MAVVAVIGLAAGILVAVFWPRDCGGVPGITLNDRAHGECVGVTDGSYLFNRPDGKTSTEDRRTMERINELQRLIKGENDAVAKGRNYVKVILLSPLTESKSLKSAISLENVQHILEGSYTALKRANHTTYFPSSTKIQLLLANQGSQQEAGDDFAGRLLAVSERDHPLVAVVGLGSSVDNTKVIARKLSRKIPMVSAVASANTLTGVPELWSVSPSNENYAQALRSLLEDTWKDTPKNGIILSDRNRDPYANTLAESYRKILKPYVLYPEQSFSGATAETPIKVSHLGPVMQNICADSKDPKKPLNIVFYAGRVADFRTVVDFLKNRNCKKGHPLTVMVGATGFAQAEEYKDLLEEANVTVIYASSSDSESWAVNAPDDTENYADFLKDYEFDRAGLVDGYAIAHHDALATVATAVGLATQGLQVPTARDVAIQFGSLNTVNKVRAASGELSFTVSGGRATGRLIPIRQIGTSGQFGLPPDHRPYKVG